MGWRCARATVRVAVLRVVSSMLTWLIDCYPDRRRGRPPALVDAAHAMGHTIFAYRNDDIDAQLDLSDYLAVRDETPPLTLFRGSHAAVKMMEKQTQRAPGAFLHATNFFPEVYCQKYGDMTISRTFRVTTYSDYAANGPGFACDKYFIKPSQEAKLFSGTVMAIGEDLGDRHYHFHRSWTQPDPEASVFIAPHVDLGREWRFVVIDGRVVTGSQYRSERGANPTDIPVETLAFAQAAADVWQPMPVFALDVAERPGGYGVVEVNQFGTSGLYECDQSAIVTALEDFLQ